MVAIGGGHGLAMSLRAIDTYAGSVTAVVATGDDGGSSGRIRAELPMPAPGDLRRCLSALAPDATMAAGFEHRFHAGSLAGHAVGNLLLAGLVDAGHDLVAAADLAARWLGLDAERVRVLPVTTEPVELVAITDAGEVRGQVAVEDAPGVRSIGFDPPSPAVPDDALEAIAAADQIVLGPGSFFTSVLGAAALPPVAKAVETATAPVVLVANLDSDPADHVATLAAHGITTDVVVVHSSTAIGDAGDTQVIEGDIVRPHGLAHDPDLLAAVLPSAFSTS
ncbi:MAG: YvcK family protein [Acidimicrobiales bacterium]|nr:YvcK family protein [Acidimicrobiales bacterium]